MLSAVSSIIVKYQILRFLVDLLGILIALRFFQLIMSDMRKYRMRSKIGQDLGAGFQVLSTDKCTISSLRLNLQVNDKYLPRIGVYFGIKVKDYFRRIVISLPYKIVYPLGSEVDGVVVQGNVGDSFITIDCNDKEKKEFELPNSYFKVNGWFERYRAKRTFFFRVSYFWNAGIPHAENKSLDIDSKEMYSPKIEELEIDFECLGDKLSLELKETIPTPEVFFERQIRWISGNGRRSHSSVEATFVDKIELEQADHDSFKQGVLLAISSSLALACGLDAIWKILDLFKV
jgi:hypothetical protein